MIITGYPTETKKDWEFTKQWFRDRSQYKDTIARLFLNPAGILPGTGLHRNAESHGIIWIGKPNLHNWHTNDINRNERSKYHSELVLFCKELGFNLDAY
jgi:bifunctional pyridoxal-dependent enzyme with beta-cystathionase and maltose regulon repressor activities